MTPAVEIIFVWAPMIGSVALVLWFAYRCRCQGMSLTEIVIDRRFLMVFLYTGALLAIYLSTFHFFYFGIFGCVGSGPVSRARRPPAHRTRYL